MFGRSKLEMKTRASPSFRRETISLRVVSSAVAVSAMRGTPGWRSASRLSSMYSGRKSCPHCDTQRSEEHTSELQSLTNLVCRLLLEKKKSTIHILRGDSERRAEISDGIQYLPA